MGSDTIEHIFGAAVCVFAESGFERARMDEIARRAGVAKGTIYYHFKSKEELFVALMNNGMERLTAYLRRRLAQVEDPQEQLGEILDAQVRYLYDNGTFAKLLISEVWGSIERQRVFRARIRDLVSIIEEVIRRGEKEGSFRTLKVQETAVAIFGAISVAVLQELFRFEEQERQDVKEERIPDLVRNLETLIHHGLIYKEAE
ncbi:TetR/AcrR family transcriptional regulator [Desmospora profundinema]|uniref:AcrR family transcriptional regulator n=1 Tax=Desmospora profundinema TaxID=1571184 RepID=A0ABU1IL98_9BACL|nr:TetR/AcrR family transcriptional regulator [Desmospora profundinema]MDR6225337.1 AcrR family transcriptional regulator [Desmospora profundinema]